MKGKKTGNKVVKTKNEKTKLIMGIAMMVFAVAVAGGTYAYYQSTITGTVSGTILAWDCLDGSGTLTTAIGNIKPGSSGSFALKVKSTNFKTDITVALRYDTPANVPGNFKLYKDSAHSTSIAMNGSTNVTAFTETGVAKNTQKTYTVYYYWPLGTTAETPVATGTTNKSFNVVYSITCKQSSTQ
jgi:hypothetical protein